MKSPNAARRSQRAHRAILEAAYELALDRGPAKVTIDAIAARAGVGKQTIYRWWPSKGALLLDVLADAVGAVSEMPDTGDVVADLTTQMTAVTDLFRSDFARFYTGLIAEAQADDAVARGLAEQLVDRAEGPRRQRLEKAQRDGQIRADVDIAAAVEALYAPLYYRLLLRTAPLSVDHVHAVIDAALRGARPSPA
ncbi:TetR/AcrR family transcriptional regulator [Kutzneria sp. 744]|uniref:TetR/AcrR family transcriptional regulator n=2 Tax=Kutzneria sp. (strain 744) TaxID=345341 RepID=UPI0003EEC1FB|nr:TetR/AcrR family transcriptional regulator [Kutzneria sp. 744]EWM17652.1 transcriptional regulator, TetR family [Kutzneria sp. 744]